MSADLLRPRDYQEECIVSLLSRFEGGAVRVPNVLATGLGKGHPLETEVPTPDGWRRWGDLAPGDHVFGRDGSSTEVLEVYDRGMLETYRVAFSDGSSVLVDGDHLWTVRDSSQSHRPWGTLETRALARLELKRSRGWRFHIPMTAPLERSSLELPLDPYVVGALISNGSMTGAGTQLTTPDLEVAARVARATECRKIKDTTPGICDRYSLPGLQPVTRALGMRVGSLEKRVPAPYLEGSLEQRLELLHGLMDGDGGGRDSSRRGVAYFTSSEGLARDVSELVASLGGTGIVKRYDRGARGVEYAVRILLPSSVPTFGTARKSGAGSSSVRNLQPKRAIVNVKLEGSSLIRCIRVAARDSLYLIGRQHIVTHNTVIFAHLIARWVAEHPVQRVMVLVHTDELVQQAVKKIRDVAPHLRVGIVKAERNEVTAQVIVASVQSLRSKARRAQIRRLGLIIVDECHHSTSKTYRAILNHYGALCAETCSPFPDTIDHDPSACAVSHSDIKVAGFTATLARGDKAKLSDVWETDPAPFTRGISFGIRRGYLLDVRGKRIVIPDLDMSKVKKSGGDYQDAALGEAMEASYAPEIIAEAYAKHAGDRKGLVFWPLVETAEHGAAAFEAEDIKSAVIHGKLGREERRLILKRLAAGDVQVVHNVAVLTEGFDDPTISCVVIARPTRSAPLYQQMVGRGLRPNLALPAGERGDCLVLDVVGASRTHDLRSLVDLSEREISDEIGMDEELSLLAMEELQEEEEKSSGAGGWPEEEPYVGETAAEEFDPLGRTTAAAWLTTFGGTYFLPAGKEHFVLLVPSEEEPGGYDVAWLHRDFRKNGDVTEHRGLSLEMATSWAEEVMEGLAGEAGVLSSAKARWRKADPSAAQKGWATRNGITIEGLNKGEVSDLRTMMEASSRIDPIIGFMLASR